MWIKSCNVFPLVYLKGVRLSKPFGIVKVTLNIVKKCVFGWGRAFSCKGGRRGADVCDGVFIRNVWCVCIVKFVCKVYVYRESLQTRFACASG